MHYANGKPAQLGDLVVLRKDPKYPKQAYLEQLGILKQGQATSNTCNGQVQVLASRHISDLGIGPWMPVSTPWDSCITIGDLMPLELPDRPATAAA